MWYAYDGGRLWKIIVPYALRAVWTDPTNSYKILRRFLGMIKEDIKGKPYSKPFSLILAIPGFMRAMQADFRRLMMKLQPARIPNLAGDRAVEWSWMAARIPAGPGEALDFGIGNSYLALIAARSGFNVVAVDMKPVKWHYTHPDLRFIQGDILKLALPEKQYDLVINCSAIEHVGLSGRYGVTNERSDGDLAAMARLRSLLKPGGVMLLTIPVGLDKVFAPLCRVYGAERLPQLLSDFTIESEEFWVKDNSNRWVLSDKETALGYSASMGSWNVSRNISALGCFVLRRPDNHQCSNLSEEIK
jgi:2-polyprenyl-3-methyl-5-hydroxy-6-metoxy-1,4-benzoquinol methylase